MIKAIETRYKGYRFRSRLEARWAVFFDALDIEWQYEPEGFELPDGTRYLPDFYLPRFNGGLWCEVKPKGDPAKKALAFSDEAGKALLLLDGEPAPRVYQLFYPGEPGIEVCFNEGYLPLTNQSEQRLFLQPGYEDRDGRISEADFGSVLMAAVYSARSARFEHGQSGAL